MGKDKQTYKQDNLETEARDYCDRCIGTARQDLLKQKELLGNLRSLMSYWLNKKTKDTRLKDTFEEIVQLNERMTTLLVYADVLFFQGNGGEQDEMMRGMKQNIVDAFKKAGEEAVN